MKVPAVLSLSQVLSGVLLALPMMSQEVVPWRSLPVMIGETGTSCDVSMSLPGRLLHDIMGTCTSCGVSRLLPMMSPG